MPHFNSKRKRERRAAEAEKLRQAREHLINMKTGTTEAEREVLSRTWNRLHKVLVGKSNELYRGVINRFLEATDAGFSFDRKGHLLVPGSMWSSEKIDEGNKFFKWYHSKDLEGGDARSSIRNTFAMLEVYSRELSALRNAHLRNSVSPNNAFEKYVKHLNHKNQFSEVGKQIRDAVERDEEVEIFFDPFRKIIDIDTPENIKLRRTLGAMFSNERSRAAFHNSKKLLQLKLGIKISPKGDIILSKSGKFYNKYGYFKEDTPLRKLDIDARNKVAGKIIDNLLALKTDKDYVSETLAGRYNLAPWEPGNYYFTGNIADQIHHDFKGGDSYSPQEDARNKFPQWVQEWELKREQRRATKRDSAGDQRQGEDYSEGYNRKKPQQTPRTKFPEPGNRTPTRDRGNVPTRSFVTVPGAAQSSAPPRTPTKSLSAEEAFKKQYGYQTIRRKSTSTPSRSMSGSRGVSRSPTSPPRATPDIFRTVPPQQQRASDANLLRPASRLAARKSKEGVALNLDARARNRLLQLIPKGKGAYEVGGDERHYSAKQLIRNYYLGRPRTIGYKTTTRDGKIIEDVLPKLFSPAEGKAYEKKWEQEFEKFIERSTDKTIPIPEKKGAHYYALHGEDKHWFPGEITEASQNYRNIAAASLGRAERKEAIAKLIALNNEFQQALAEAGSLDRLMAAVGKVPKARWGNFREFIDSDLKTLELLDADTFSDTGALVFNPLYSTELLKAFNAYAELPEGHKFKPKAATTSSSSSSSSSSAGGSKYDFTQDGVDVKWTPAMVKAFDTFASDPWLQPISGNMGITAVGFPNYPGAEDSSEAILLYANKGKQYLSQIENVLHKILAEAKAKAATYLPPGSVNRYIREMVNRPEVIDRYLENMPYLKNYVYNTPEVRKQVGDARRAWVAKRGPSPEVNATGGPIPPSISPSSRVPSISPSPIRTASTVARTIARPVNQSTGSPPLTPSVRPSFKFAQSESEEAANIRKMREMEARKTAAMGRRGRSVTFPPTAAGGATSSPMPQSREPYRERMARENAESAARGEFPQSRSFTRDIQSRVYNPTSSVSSMFGQGGAQTSPGFTAGSGFEGYNWDKGRFDPTSQPTVPPTSTGSNFRRGPGVFGSTDIPMSSQFTGGATPRTEGQGYSGQSSQQPGGSTFGGQQQGFQGETFTEDESLRYQKEAERMEEMKRKIFEANNVGPSQGMPEAQYAEAEQPEAENMERKPYNRITHLDDLLKWWREEGAKNYEASKSMAKRGQPGRALLKEVVDWARKRPMAYDLIQHDTDPKREE